LPTDRLHQIDFCSSGIAKLDRHLGSDFEAARSDSGPNRYHQTLGFAAELVHHSRNRFRANLSNYATPSGVNRRHGPIRRVGDQDWETIGGSDCQTDVGNIRHQRVAFTLWTGVLDQQNPV
jgi:hypothetical protein